MRDSKASKAQRPALRPLSAKDLRRAAGGYTEWVVFTLGDVTK